VGRDDGSGAPADEGRQGSRRRGILSRARRSFYGVRAGPSSNSHLDVHWWRRRRRWVLGRLPVGSGSAAYGPLVIGFWGVGVNWEASMPATVSPIVPGTGVGRAMRTQVGPWAPSGEGAGTEGMEGRT
jgi:hypothetical protein